VFDYILHIYFMILYNTTGMYQDISRCITIFHDVSRYLTMYHDISRL